MEKHKKFFLQALSHKVFKFKNLGIKARGTQDILITATDNLNGFTDTIKTMFPNSVTQICVVHQIRNTMRYVVWKDKKEFVKDMKQIDTTYKRSC